MAFFRNLFRREDPKEESPLELVELEPEKEITPEHSPETLKMIEQIDGKIADSEKLLGGLGRLAREQGILASPEELDEIYAPKEISQMALKAEHDAFAFKSAGQGLFARDAIKRFVTLGLAGSKYAMEDKKGMVDKRKLTESARDTKYFKLHPDELAEAVQGSGLRAEEVMAKTYVEGESGVEKVILRRPTEPEADKAAGEILARRLNDLETKTGVDLVKQKQGLEEFKKLKDQNKDILDEKSMAKLGDEEITRQGMIDEKQAALNSGLEIIRAPLLEQQKGLAEALAGFSPILAEAAGREKTYEQEVKGLQDKIRRIKGAKPLAEVLGDKIKDWEGEKAQAEVNQRDFMAKKQALNMRLAELKRSQAEVDKTLARINKIGKTKEELREEQAVKQRAEKAPQRAQTVAGITPEQKRKARKINIEFPDENVSGRTAESGESDDDSSVDDLGNYVAKGYRAIDQEAVEQKRRAEMINKIDQAVDEETRSSAPAETDDYDDKAAAERRKIELDEQQAEAKQSMGKRKATADEISSGWFKPKGGMREPGRRPVEEAVAAARPETRPAEDRGAEKKETEIVRPVRFWLNAIFGGTLEKPIHDKIMRRHFRLGKIFDKSTGMTAKQAEIALYGFQVEAEGFRPVHSREEARKKIGQILENIDDYDQEKGEAASSKPARREARLEQPAEATRENIIPGLAETFGKAVAKDWDRNIKGGDASGGGLALPPEQVKTKAASKRKSIDQGKRNSTDGNRSARKLRKQELAEAALKDEARLEGQAETQQNPAEVPKLEDKKNSPINGLKSALEKAEALAKAKAGNQVDGSGQVEAPATVAPAPEAESGEKKIKWSLKRWKKVLGLRDNTVEANRAIKKNFMPSPGSVDEALEAFKRYKTAMGEMPKAFDENAIKQLIKNNIEASLK